MLVVSATLLVTFQYSIGDAKHEALPLAELYDAVLSILHRRCMVIAMAMGLKPEALDFQYSIGDALGKLARVAKYGAGIFQYSIGDAG